MLFLVLLIQFRASHMLGSTYAHQVPTAELHPDVFSFWDNLSLNCPGWPGTCGPAASGSTELAFQVCTSEPGLVCVLTHKEEFLKIKFLLSLENTEADPFFPQNEVYISITHLHAAVGTLKRVACILCVKENSLSHEVSNQWPMFSFCSGRQMKANQSGWEDWGRQSCACN